MFQRIKEKIRSRIPRINPYWAVALCGLFFTFVVGDSNLYRRFSYDQKIRALEREIEHYQEEIQENRQKLNDLRTDKEGLERFAREEYYMKRPNEEVYIIREK